MLSIRYKNFKGLSEGFRSAPAELENNLYQAIGQSMEMVATESKRLAPIDEGVLRSSIGSSSHESGIFRQDGLTGYVGTRLVYAWYQHENESLNHPRGGEAKYMEKGAERARPFVQKTMRKAVQDTINSIK